MTKLERAIKEAEQLPSDLREQLGEKLLHYIHNISRCGMTSMLAFANSMPAKGVTGGVFLRP